MQLPVAKDRFVPISADRGYARKQSVFSNGLRCRKTKDFTFVMYCKERMTGRIFVN